MTYTSTHQLRLNWSLTTVAVCGSELLLPAKSAQDPSGRRPGRRRILINSHSGWMLKALLVSHEPCLHLVYYCDRGFIAGCDAS